MEFFMGTQITAPLPKTRPAGAGGRPLDEPLAVLPGNGDSAPDGEHDERVDLDVPMPSRTWIIAVSIAGAVVLLVLFAVGVLPRLHTNKELAADAQAVHDAPVPVNV